MSDKTYLGSNAVDFDFGKSLMPVSRVNILVDSEHYFTAGDDTGRTIEKTCPWGSQEMAESVLAALKGVSYIPYTANTSIIDPSVEVGDGITAGGVYSVVANKNISFDSLLTADVSAPGGDEKDDEYPYITKSERQVKLQQAQTRSYITKTAEDVRLGVESLVDDRMAEIDVQLESITGTVTGIDGRVGSLELTADSLTGRIESAEGDIGSLKLTATSLESSIENANGEISSLKQTAEGFRAELNGLDSKYILQSSWNSLTSSFVTASGVSSQIQQSLQNISLSVTGSLGGTASISITAGGQTKTDTLSLSGVRDAFADDDTDITISAGTVTFATGKFVSTGKNFAVDSNGRLTATSIFLEKGGTYVGYAANNATVVSDGHMYLTEDSVDSYALYGITGSHNVALIFASSDSQYFTSSQEYGVVVGFNNHIYLNCGANGSIKSDRGTVSTSDGDKKKDITPLDEKYLNFIDSIQPVSFRFRECPDDIPLSIGYVAQDVEKALYSSGMTRKDFRALEGENGSGNMGLCYDDFIPILHLKINDLEKRLKRLEATA